MERNSALFIYITGCDGTGKTTQSQLLLEKLTADGINTRHVWLRFPFLFSLPLLAYARLGGFSWYETKGGFRHGYWDFNSSWLLRTCFPWFLLMDACLASLVNIYLPLGLGKSLICERYVLDMIVDLSVALSDDDFHKKVPGRLFFRLLPANSIIFLLDLDAPTIRHRRPDLVGDQRLETRLYLYRKLKVDLILQTLSSNIPAEQVNRLMIESIKG